MQKKELVAVLDLGILGGTEAQSVAISNQLRSELLKTGRVTLVDRGQMDAILKEQALQQSGCTSQECAVQVGQLLGVRRIVTGTLTKIADDLWQVAVQLLDVETGETLVQDTFNHDGNYKTLLLNGMTKPAQALAAGTKGQVAAAPVPPPKPEPPLKKQPEKKLELPPKQATQKINRADWALVAGGVLLAGAIVTGLRARSNASDANDQAATAQDQEDQSKMDKANAKFDDAKASARTATTLLLVGGGMIIYWALSGDEVRATAFSEPGFIPDSPISLDVSAMSVRVGWRIRW